MSVLVFTLLFFFFFKQPFHQHWRIARGLGGQNPRKHQRASGGQSGGFPRSRWGLRAWGYFAAPHGRLGRGGGESVELGAAGRGPSSALETVREAAGDARRGSETEVEEDWVWF